jgi:hypothetical protein
MGDIYSLAERVRGKLTLAASRGDPDLRRVLGHARLLDSLFNELSESTKNGNGAQDEVVAGSGRCDLGDLDDSDPDSDSDSDSNSDSDSDSETDSDSDSDSDSEWRSYADFRRGGPGDFSYKQSGDDSGADMEREARDWPVLEFWETAKSIAAGRPIQVSVHEALDEIES